MSQQEKLLPVPGEKFEVEGCSAFVMQPDGRQNERPWVWYAPTLLQYPDQSEVWMIEQLLSAGVAFAGVDVGESSGNPEGRRSYTAFYSHMTGVLGLAGKPALLARSRGGLMLYNWASENANCVGCIAGIYPVCNLKSFPTLVKACDAYGLAAGELAAQLSQHNPIDRLAPLADAGVPIYHIHGDSDEVVPIEMNSGILADRYRELGGSVTLSIAEGEGHSLWRGFFQSQELVDFVLKHIVSR